MPLRPRRPAAEAQADGIRVPGADPPQVALERHLLARRGPAPAAAAPSGCPAPAPRRCPGPRGRRARAGPRARQHCRAHHHPAVRVAVEAPALQPQTRAERREVRLFLLLAFPELALQLEPGAQHLPGEQPQEQGHERESDDPRARHETHHPTAGRVPGLRDAGTPWFSPPRSSCSPPLPLRSRLRRRIRCFASSQRPAISRTEPRTPSRWTGAGPTSSSSARPADSPVQSLYVFEVDAGQARELLSAETLLRGAAQQLSPAEKAQLERQRVAASGHRQLRALRRRADPAHLPLGPAVPGGRAGPAGGTPRRAGGQGASGDRRARPAAVARREAGQLREGMGPVRAGARDAGRSGGSPPAARSG